MIDVGTSVFGSSPLLLALGKPIKAPSPDKVRVASKAFDSFDPKMLESSERADSRRPQYLLILNDSEYYVCDEDGCKRESELQP